MSEFAWVEGIGLDVIQASKREPRIMRARTSSRHYSVFRVTRTAAAFSVASWFETREDALPMRPKIASWQDLIPRSIANGSRERAPDDRLRDASRRMKPLN
jgi:hypothetical protein